MVVALEILEKTEKQDKMSQLQFCNMHFAEVKLVTVK